MNRILANLPHHDQDWEDGNGHGPAFSDSDVSKEDVKAAVVAAAEGVLRSLSLRSRRNLPRTFPRA
jgi:hypothetical protein